LVVNVGQISQPRPSGDCLRATYTLPDALFPQVAIIAALSKSGQLLDWIAVPLDGETVIDTKTERHGNVRVRINDTDFGPVEADRNGNAGVGIVVPPGVDRGTTIVTDRIGNKKTTTFDLNVLPFGRMLGICPSTGDRLVLLVTDPYGKPEENSRFELKSSVVDFYPIRMLAPGVYEALIMPPEDVAADTEVTISAKLKGDEVSQTTCSVALNQLSPVAVRLSTTPSAFVAGSSTVVFLKLEFLDLKGKPVPPVPVEFSADIGEISDVLPTSARWTLPNAFEGKARGVAIARSRTSRVTSANAFVQLRAGPISRLELSTRNATVRADGYSETTIVAKGYDAFGNPVSSARLTAEAEGTLSPFSKNRNGNVFEATYTAPYDDHPSEDTLVVRDDSGAVEASIRIKLLPSTTTVTLCPKMGYATNFGEISSPLFGIDVAVRPLILRGRLSVGLEVLGYWNESEEHIADSSEQSSLSIWAIPLLARTVYQIPLDQLFLYAGVATGISIVGTQIASQNDSRVETLGVYFALSGILGVERIVGPGRVVIEMAYLYAPFEASNIEGNLGGLLLTGGYRFEF